MMSRLRKTGLGAVVLVGSALLLGSLGGARADTIVDYNLTACFNDSGNSYCGSAGTNYGTVVVDINSAGTSATITYNLTNGAIADYVSNPQDASATFQMTGVSSFSVTSSNDVYGTSAWSNISGSGGAEIDYGEPGGAGSNLGVFTDGVSCSDNYYGCGTSLVITVTGTGLAVSTDSAGYFAGLDTQSADPQNGAVGTTLAATPLPGALAMLAPVLGGGFLALRRRRRKLSAAAA